MSRSFRHAAVAALAVVQAATLPAAGCAQTSAQRGDLPPEVVAGALVYLCVQSHLPAAERQPSEIVLEPQARSLTVSGQLNGTGGYFSYSIANGESFYARQEPGATVMQVEAALSVANPLRGREPTLNAPDRTVTAMRPETKARIDGIARCVGLDPDYVPGGLRI